MAAFVGIIVSHIKNEQFGIVYLLLQFVYRDKAVCSKKTEMKKDQYDKRSH